MRESLRDRCVLHGPEVCCQCKYRTSAARRAATEARAIEVSAAWAQHRVDNRVNADGSTSSNSAANPIYARAAMLAAAHGLAVYEPGGIDGQCLPTSVANFVGFNVANMLSTIRAGVTFIQRKLDMRARPQMPAPGVPDSDAVSSERAMLRLAASLAEISAELASAPQRLVASPMGPQLLATFLGINIIALRVAQDASLLLGAPLQRDVVVADVAPDALVPVNSLLDDFEVSDVFTPHADSPRMFNVANTLCIIAVPGHWLFADRADTTFAVAASRRPGSFCGADGVVLRGTLRLAALAAAFLPRPLVTEADKVALSSRVTLVTRAAFASSLPGAPVPSSAVQIDAATATSCVGVNLSCADLGHVSRGDEALDPVLSRNERTAAAAAVTLGDNEQAATTPATLLQGAGVGVQAVRRLETPTAQRGGGRGGSGRAAAVPTATPPPPRAPPPPINAGLGHGDSAQGEADTAAQADRRLETPTARRGGRRGGRGRVRVAASAAVSPAPPPPPAPSPPSGGQGRGSLAGYTRGPRQRAPPPAVPPLPAGAGEAAFAAATAIGRAAAVNGPSGAQTRRRATLH